MRLHEGIPLILCLFDLPGALGQGLRAANVTDRLRLAGAHCAALRPFDCDGDGSGPDVARRTQNHIYIAILRSFLSLLGWIPMGIGMTFVVLEDGCRGHNLAPDRSATIALVGNACAARGKKNHIYIVIWVLAMRAA